MSKINETKLNSYANKLYRGELTRYKKKRDWDLSITSFFLVEKKIKRKPITKSQEKVVLDKYKEKCVVCRRDYDKDDFEIHHIDGDRSKSVTTNLVPLCHRCHKKITTIANAKLKDYVNTHKPKSSFSTLKIPKYKPPKFKF